MTKALSTSKMLLNGETLTLKKFEQAIDEEINHLKETGDFRRIDNVLITMNGMEHFSKFTQCKVLYHYKKWWDAEEKDEDEFYAKNEKIASKIIIDRYISLWDKYETGAFPDEIKERSLDDQIKIAKALDAGYEIDDEMWDELITTPNVHKAIQRDVKGKKPTKNSYVPRIDEAGRLIVRHMDMDIYCGNVILPDDVDVKELSKELEDEEISPKRREYIIKQRALTKMLARIKSGLYIS